MTTPSRAKVHYFPGTTDAFAGMSKDEAALKQQMLDEKERNARVMAVCASQQLKFLRFSFRGLVGISDGYVCMQLKGMCPPLVYKELGTVFIVFEPGGAGHVDDMCTVVWRFLFLSRV